MIELPIIERAEQGAGRPRERFWRSYADLNADPAFKSVHSEELMPGASEAPPGSSRRQFLQIMGASMAMAGLAACRRPEEEILPYTRRPEEIVPGIPLYYATALPFRGVSRGVLVESHEGRPTKVEGNPEHPGSQGTTSPFEQASVLALYDPDRSQVVLREGAESNWNEFARFTGEVGQRAATLRLAVVAEPTASPTMARLRGALSSRFPALRWVTYAAEGDDPASRPFQASAGGSVRPVYDFSEVDVIVSLDADFLGPTERNFLQNTRTFAAGRRLESADDRMSRLYVVESTFSLTGGMSDHRLRMRSSDVPGFAGALAAALGAGAGAPNARFGDHPFLRAVVEDVRESGGRAVILPGDGQSAEVHRLAAAMNASIGSSGVRYLTTDQAPEPPQAEALAALGAEAMAGRIDAIVFLGANPVYSAPADFAFDEVVKRVPVSIHHGLYVDETAQHCTWHLPATHPLEAWGDGRAYDGLASIVQPLIAPLYADARSDVEVLGLLARGTAISGYDLVRESWQNLGEEGWRRSLHDGFIPGTEYAEAGAPGLVEEVALLQAAPDGIEVVFHLDPTVLDGSFSNNAWMQELPDPVTKIVWDNVATMSRATAEQLGVRVRYDAGKFYSDVIEIAAGPHTLRAPIWIVPGHADESIGLNLGYGRRLASPREAGRRTFFNTEHKSDVYAEGPIANGVGVNAAPLRTGRIEPMRMGDLQVTATGDAVLVATTQEHGSMEGRPLARMGTLTEFREHPTFARDSVPVVGQEESWETYPELWHRDHPRQAPAHLDSPYAKYQWGMVIDMNACTGCNACIVACNSENNIQMVGKDQVSLGREMLWLRVDRYYVTDEEGDGTSAGDVDGVQMVMQPLPCQHCENAPCESVCPVAATMHSSDGTNQMIYNRCIGTRYCSNNCPYKVRRFNFYNWSKTLPTQVQMQQNPNVTVRFRGVMEKCSFCVQRIREGNRREIVEGRPIRDGEVKTACAQACPADAIVFGDVADPATKVSHYRRNPRRYELLAELNVKPRTSYLARVRNPNPQLSGRS